MICLLMLVSHCTIMLSNDNDEEVWKNVNSNNNDDHNATTKQCRIVGKNNIELKVKAMSN